MTTGAALFARVAGIPVMTNAAWTARASLTAFYEGVVAVLGTPGAAAVTAALAQEGGIVTGTVTLPLLDDTAAGTYVVHGQLEGKRFVLRGANGRGARLRWTARLTRDRAVRGPVRIILAGARLKGLLVLSPKRAPGACGSASFAGEILRESIKQRADGATPAAA